jgi:hypothetical protein
MATLVPTRSERQRPHKCRDSPRSASQVFGVIPSDHAVSGRRAPVTVRRRLLPRNAGAGFGCGADDCVSSQAGVSGSRRRSFSQSSSAYAARLSRGTEQQQAPLPGPAVCSHHATHRPPSLARVLRCAVPGVLKRRRATRSPSALGYANAKPDGKLRIGFLPRQEVGVTKSEKSSTRSVARSCCTMKCGCGGARHRGRGMESADAAHRRGGRRRP